MNTSLIVLFIVVFAAVAVLQGLKKSGRGGKPAAYQAAAVLTNAERAFADALEQAIGPDHRLLIKMRVADVITPRTSDRAAFLKISQKHLDFVVTDRDWNVVAAIELNDRSHNSSRRQQRDQFLKQAFESAGVVLHFVPARSRYDVAKLAELLRPVQTQSDVVEGARRLN
jgi:hypothetical protein